MIVNKNFPLEKMTLLYLYVYKMYVFYYNVIFAFPWIDEYFSIVFTSWSTDHRSRGRDWKGSNTEKLLIRISWEDFLPSLHFRFFPSLSHPLLFNTLSLLLFLFLSVCLGLSFYLLPLFLFFLFYPERTWISGLHVCHSWNGSS